MILHEAMIYDGIYDIFGFDIISVWFGISDRLDTAIAHKVDINWIDRRFRQTSITFDYFVPISTCTAIKREPQNMKQTLEVSLDPWNPQ
jgi:hypothetical protein